MIERTIFREEHHIFRESVRRFVDREIVPFHAQWEKDGIVPRELWLKAGAEGLLPGLLAHLPGLPGALLVAAREGVVDPLLGQSLELPEVLSAQIVLPEALGAAVGPAVGACVVGQLVGLGDRDAARWGKAIQE